MSCVRLPQPKLLAFWTQAEHVPCPSTRLSRRWVPKVTMKQLKAVTNQRYRVTLQT